MKKITLGVAAAVALGFAAFSGAASASPAGPAKTSIVKPMTDVSAQRYVERRRVIRRAPHCTVRKIVTRGPHGHRVVRTSRVCR